MAVAALVAVVATFFVATPAFADTTLCSNNSYSTCTDAGYTDHGYAANSSTSYWGMYSGHNCTNYVASTLQNVNGAMAVTGLGNAKDWATNAANKGVTVNSTPAKGAVAQWNANAGTASADGHVAYLEDVKADGTLVLSDDTYSAGPFRWRELSPGSSSWPSNFIHFKDISPSPPGLAVELIHHWQSGSGGTDAVKVTPGGVTGGGPTTIGAVAPGNGQFGLGDFNGDSVKDLYLVVTQGDPSGKSVVFVAAGPSFNSFLATVQVPMGQFGPGHGDVVIGDFTGDGKADVGVFFANNGSPSAAFGVLNAATTFQSWSYLNTVPIGGHDGTRSDAVAGDFNGDQVLDLGVGFHQGTPSGNVDFFTLSGASSYQSVTGTPLPLGGWLDGGGQLLSGRFGTASDQLGVIYTSNTPSGKPDLFVLSGMNALAGSWTLQVGAAPANQRTFIGI